MVAKYASLNTHTVDENAIEHYEHPKSSPDPLESSANASACVCVCIYFSDLRNQNDSSSPDEDYSV